MNENINLPELPEPYQCEHREPREHYTANQVREAQRAAVIADRAQRQEPAWWASALNRRATVEQWMFDAARGKRPMPTAQELREWAIKLGTPAEEEPVQRQAVPPDEPGSAGKALAIREHLERQLAEMTARKDDAYEERNKVVAALAKVFPSGVARTAIEGWSEDWHGCVYIDLPTGQVSWHFHDSQAHLFADLPPYTGEWDGHDTPEKYRRVAALRQAVPQGWKLVPVGVRPACCDRGRTEECCSSGCVHDEELARANKSWSAALSASPQNGVQAQDTDGGKGGQHG